MSLLSRNAPISATRLPTQSGSLVIIRRQTLLSLIASAALRFRRMGISWCRLLLFDFVLLSSR